MAVTRRWYHWFAPEDSAAERKLIVKLDLLIVPYSFLLYWVKYIDQVNISNAYVSGMSRDLGFHGNQLVQLQTIYTVGSVVGALPFVYLFPRVPMHVLVPTLDLLWGLFTLLQYRSQSFGEVAAYRFLLAFTEASYFPGVHFLLGSWYRRDEIGRRGGFFYTGLTLGALTASLLEGAAIRHLDGLHGLAGWRWAFIINALITFPLALVGFVVYPGTPERPNRLVLRAGEVAAAQARLVRDGARVRPTPFSLALLRRVVLDWRLYFFTLWVIVFFNASCNGAAYLLWLKSLHRYSTARLNNLGALAPGMGLFFVLFITTSADLWLGRWGAILLASAFNFTALTILTVWRVPEAATWFAFAVNYSGVSVSSVLFGWLNVLLRDSPEERALYLVVATSVANAFVAWIPLLTYPTKQAPRYPHGYAFSLAMCVCMVAVSTAVWYLFGNNGEKRRGNVTPPADGSGSGSGNGSGSDGDVVDGPDVVQASKTETGVRVSAV